MDRRRRQNIVRFFLVAWAVTLPRNGSTLAPSFPLSSSLVPGRCTGLGMRKGDETRTAAPLLPRARNAQPRRCFVRALLAPRIQLEDRRSGALFAAAEDELSSSGFYEGSDASSVSEGENSPRAWGGDGDKDVGGYDATRDKLALERQTVVVGDPQKKAAPEKMNIEKVLMELQAIQSQGPKKYCILGTRHCSFLHQQIIEMLAYAIVLSGNHLYTSGAAGTNAAAIRGALRAFQPHLLTVVLPQSMSKQLSESQELLENVANVVTMPQNDAMPLDLASRICNSHLLNQTDHLISFAFHESKTVIEAAKEAQELDMLVTLLYLD